MVTSPSNEVLTDERRHIGAQFGRTLGTDIHEPQVARVVGLGSPDHHDLRHLLHDPLVEGGLRLLLVVVLSDHCIVASRRYHDRYPAWVALLSCSEIRGTRAGPVSAAAGAGRSLAGCRRPLLGDIDIGHQGTAPAQWSHVKLKPSLRGTRGLVDLMVSRLTLQGHGQDVAW